MQYELVPERRSKDNVQVEWGSSDKGDDIDHFFPHVGSCTQIFLDLCSLPDRELSSTEDTVTITKVLSLRFPLLCC